MASSHHSPNLMRTKSLCIAHCSHALLSYLPSSDGERRSTEDYDLVFRILTESLIPAAHTLVHDEAFDCKVVSIRLALHVMCLSSKKIGDVIASLIEGWYRGHDRWRGAFESAVRIMVGYFICVFVQPHCCLQVKDDNWQFVITLLRALMEQLPNDLHSPIATKFLPALNEVCHTHCQCFLRLRINLRNSFSTHLRYLSKRSQNFLRSFLKSSQNSSISLYLLARREPRTLRC